VSLLTGTTLINTIASLYEARLGGNHQNAKSVYIAAP
jgi:hypothetical protein